MGGYEPSSQLLIISGKSAFYRGDVGQDAALRQVGDDLIEHGDGLIKAHRIDQQIGGKIHDLLVVEELPGVEEIFQLAPVHVKHPHLIIEAERFDQP